MMCKKDMEVKKKRILLSAHKQHQGLQRTNACVEFGFFLPCFFTLFFLSRFASLPPSPRRGDATAATLLLAASDARVSAAGEKKKKSFFSPLSFTRPTLQLTQSRKRALSSDLFLFAASLASAAPWSLSPAATPGSTRTWRRW